MKTIGIMVCLITVFLFRAEAEKVKLNSPQIQERQVMFVSKGNEDSDVLLIEDQNGIWKGQTSVDIFAQSYMGTAEADSADKITVENGGSDEEKLIAPGTEKSYTFQITNPRETDVRYFVSFKEENTSEKLPLEVRIRCGENFFLGGEEKWETIDVLNPAVHEGVLEKNSSEKYTLEWRWVFEKDDVYDTFLGNEAVEKLLEQKILIDVQGEASSVPGEKEPYHPVENENNREEVPIQPINTGDQNKIYLWIFLLFLTALGILIFLLIRMGKKEQFFKIAGKTGNLILFVFMIAVIGCNLYLIMGKIVYKENYPSIFGYSTAVVVSGSMADVIEIDDLVVIHREEDYDIGDIITYESGKSLVTHRIIGKTSEGFRTKGDANNMVDLDPVKEDKILGKVVTVIPGVGKTLYFFRAPFRLIESLGRYCTGDSAGDHARIASFQILTYPLEQSPVQRVLAAGDVNGRASYEFSVENSSEVEIYYDILVENLPLGVNVFLDDQDVRMAEDNTMVFGQEPLKINENRPHTLQFSPGEADISDQTVRIRIRAQQVDES